MIPTKDNNLTFQEIIEQSKKHFFTSKNHEILNDETIDMLMAHFARNLEIQKVKILKNMKADISKEEDQFLQSELAKKAPITKKNNENQNPNSKSNQYDKELISLALTSAPEIHDQIEEKPIDILLREIDTLLKYFGEELHLRFNFEAFKKDFKMKEEKRFNSSPSKERKNAKNEYGEEKQSEDNSGNKNSNTNKTPKDNDNMLEGLPDALPDVIELKKRVYQLEKGNEMLQKILKRKEDAFGNQLTKYLDEIMYYKQMLSSEKEKKDKDKATKTIMENKNYTNLIPVEKRLLTLDEILLCGGKHEKLTINSFLEVEQNFQLIKQLLSEKESKIVTNLYSLSSIILRLQEINQTPEYQKDQNLFNDYKTRFYSFMSKLQTVFFADTGRLIEENNKCHTQIRKYESSLKEAMSEKNEIVSALLNERKEKQALLDVIEKQQRELEKYSTSSTPSSNMFDISMLGKLNKISTREASSDTADFIVLYNDLSQTDITLIAEGEEDDLNPGKIRELNEKIDQLHEENDKMFRELETKSEIIKTFEEEASNIQTQQQNQPNSIINLIPNSKNSGVSTPVSARSKNSDAANSFFQINALQTEIEKLKNRLNETEKAKEQKNQELNSKIDEFDKEALNKNLAISNVDLALAEKERDLFNAKTEIEDLRSKLEKYEKSEKDKPKQTNSHRSARKRDPSAPDLNAIDRKFSSHSNLTETETEESGLDSDNDHSDTENQDHSIDKRDDSLISPTKPDQPENSASPCSTSSTRTSKPSTHRSNSLNRVLSAHSSQGSKSPKSASNYTHKNQLEKLKIGTDMSPRHMTKVEIEIKTPHSAKRYYPENDPQATANRVYPTQLTMDDYNLMGMLQEDLHAMLGQYIAREDAMYDPTILMHSARKNSFYNPSSARASNSFNRSSGKFFAAPMVPTVPLEPVVHYFPDPDTNDALNQQVKHKRNRKSRPEKAKFSANQSPLLVDYDNSSENLMPPDEKHGTNQKNANNKRPYTTNQQFSDYEKYLAMMGENNKNFRKQLMTSNGPNKSEESTPDSTPGRGVYFTDKHPSKIVTDEFLDLGNRNSNNFSKFSKFMQIQNVRPRNISPTVDGAFIVKALNPNQAPASKEVPKSAKEDSVSEDTLSSTRHDSAPRDRPMAILDRIRAGIAGSTPISKYIMNYNVSNHRPSSSPSKMNLELKNGPNQAIRSEIPQELDSIAHSEKNSYIGSPSPMNMLKNDNFNLVEGLLTRNSSSFYDYKERGDLSGQSSPDSASPKNTLNQISEARSFASKSAKSNISIKTPFKSKRVNSTTTPTTKNLVQKPPVHPKVEETPKSELTQQQMSQNFLKESGVFTPDSSRIQYQMNENSFKIEPQADPSVPISVVVNNTPGTQQQQENKEEYDINSLIQRKKLEYVTRIEKKANFLIQWFDKTKIFVFDKKEALDNLLKRVFRVVSLSPKTIEEIIEPQELEDLYFEVRKWVKEIEKEQELQNAKNHENNIGSNSLQNLKTSNPEQYVQIKKHQKYLTKKREANLWDKKEQEQFLQLQNKNVNVQTVMMRASFKKIEEKKKMNFNLNLNFNQTQKEGGPPSTSIVDNMFNFLPQKKEPDFYLIGTGKTPKTPKSP